MESFQVLPTTRRGSISKYGTRSAVYSPWMLSRSPVGVWISCSVSEMLPDISSGLTPDTVTVLSASG